MLETVPVWEPVLAADLGASLAADRGAVDRQALAQRLPALRWPEPFPFDSRLAMLAATFARRSGRAIAFSLAAMRQAFAAGRDLAVEDNVLIAGAACELHPRAILKGVASRGVRDALAGAGARARALGVDAVPALADDGRIFTGPHALDELVSARRG